MKTNDFDQVLRNYTEEEILLRKMKYQERLAFVNETGFGVFASRLKLFTMKFCSENGVSATRQILHKR